MVHACVQPENAVALAEQTQGRCLLAQDRADCGYAVSVRIHSRLPLHRLEQAISPGVAAQLQARGFALVDDVLGGEAATALRREIEALRQVPVHCVVT